MHFRFAFFVFILSNFLSLEYCIGEVWDQRGFIRIASEPCIKAIDRFSYSTGQLMDKAPEEKGFIFFDESKTNSIREITSVNDIWYRIILENTTTITKKYAVRFIGYPEDITVFVNGLLITDSVNKVLQNTYYESELIEVFPGRSEILIHSNHKFGKTLIYNIDVVPVNEVFNDKSEFFSKRENQRTAYLLYAFCALLFFQFLYVIIQFYYHRTTEYIDYALYLFCILFYFFIRFDLYYKTDLNVGSHVFFRVFVNNILLLLPYVFYLRFARHYINMKVRFPQLNAQVKRVEILLLIIIIPYLMPFIFGPFNIAGIITFSIMIPLFIYTLYLIWFFFRSRDQLIRFLLVGSLFAATGHFLAMTTSFMIDYFDVIPIYFTMVGLSFEIFFFNTGLGFKAKYEQQEKLKAQQVYITQLDENRKMQERLENMRNKIAGDLHDDVGSTLSSIGLYSQVASKQLDSNPSGVKDILIKISGSTQRMMEAMSDIVWAIHSRNDEANELFVRMRNYMNDRLVQSPTEFSLDISKDVESLQLTMEARRNLLLFFKEALNNAAKYSNATSIKSGLEMVDNNLRLYVRDNGSGFNLEFVRQGTGLHSLEARSKAMNGKLEIDTVPGKGTEISMIIPLKNIIN